MLYKDFRCNAFAWCRIVMEIFTKSFVKNNSTSMSIISCTSKTDVIIVKCQDRNLYRNDLYFLFNYADS